MGFDYLFNDQADTGICNYIKSSLCLVTSFPYLLDVDTKFIRLGCRIDNTFHNDDRQ